MVDSVATGFCIPVLLCWRLSAHMKRGRHDRDESPRVRCRDGRHSSRRTSRTGDLLPGAVRRSAPTGGHGCSTRASGTRRQSSESRCRKTDLIRWARPPLNPMLAIGAHGSLAVSQWRDHGVCRNRLAGAVAQQPGHVVPERHRVRPMPEAALEWGQPRHQSPQHGDRVFVEHRHAAHRRSSDSTMSFQVVAIC
jgi:hypothetical protein